MTDKRLTVILFGSDRNLWQGGPLRIRVTDVFGPDGPRQLFEGEMSGATVELKLKLPFDAGQSYGFDFSAPDHRPAWQLIRRADFVRGPDNVEAQDLILRLMIVPDSPQSSDLPGGFARLQLAGSPIAAPGAGLDEAAFQQLAPEAQMALLNIDAKLKATLINSVPLQSFVKAVRHVATDRLFLFVDAALKTQVERSADFAGAPGHGAPKRLPGVPAHPDSWKHRRFGEGNVQVSFSRDAEALSSGGVVHSVDADIDLGRGLAHVVEWLENNVFKPGHKTDQTLIYGQLYSQGILPLYTLDPIARTTARVLSLRPVRAASRRKAMSSARNRRAAAPKPRTPRAKPLQKKRRRHVDA